MTTLFDAHTAGKLSLANRIAMAPMTRSRADAGGVPTDLAATYYAQRADAGLIITEGIQPSAVGQGYIATPGLHTDDQVAGWRTVTDAVHARGGTIVAQLMHSGRIGHPSLLPAGLHPVGPSAVAAQGKTFTYEGPKDNVVPKELSSAEITVTIADFAAAARRAIEAGFDGVELHGANGYLIHQFLSANANRRTDEYGGNTAGHIRFAVEVARAVTEAIGADRVGIRISPGGTFNDIEEHDVPEVYGALVRALAPLDLAYLHLVENPDLEITRTVRHGWPGTLILNPHTGSRPTDQVTAQARLDAGLADVVSFGALFLANPDLPERFRRNASLNQPDPATFYGGDHHGYTDYPALEESAA